MITVYQNDDFKRTFQHRDIKTKQPTNFSLFTGVGVWIYYDDGTVFKKFASNVNDVMGNPMVGFSKLHITSATQGKFLITFDSSETKTAQLGRLTMQIKFQYTDADVTDNIFHLCGRPLTHCIEIKPTPASITDYL